MFANNTTAPATKAPAPTTHTINPPPSAPPLFPPLHSRHSTQTGKVPVSRSRKISQERIRRKASLRSREGEEWFRVFRRSCRKSLLYALRKAGKHPRRKGSFPNGSGFVLAKASKESLKRSALDLRESTERLLRPLVRSRRKSLRSFEHTKCFRFAYVRKQSRKQRKAFASLAKSRGSESSRERIETCFASLPGRNVTKCETTRVFAKPSFALVKAKQRENVSLSCEDMKNYFGLTLAKRERHPR